MKEIGIFYGSDGGSTKGVAEKIAKAIGAEAKVFDVAKAKKEDILGFENLILATATYGSGDLQDDWDSIIGQFKESDFAGKVIGLVAVGDQDTYSDTFVDSMFALYEVAKGGSVVGQTSTDGYSFDESKSVVGGKFVGLALDEDNQSDETDARISAWVSAIKGSFK